MRNDYEYDPKEEPVSSNYYPINPKIVIIDEAQNLEIAVINDRPQAGSSLFQGSVEFLIHRRLYKDDGFGVNEPLNEVEYDRGLYVRGQHYLTFGPSSSSALKTGDPITIFEKQLAQKKLLQPWILLGDMSKEGINITQVNEQLNLRVRH